MCQQGSGGARIFSLGWPKGEIMTHVGVAISRYDMLEIHIQRCICIEMIVFNYNYYNCEYSCFHLLYVSSVTL